MEKGDKAQTSPEIPYANMTPVPPQQQHQGIPSGYMGSPIDLPYGSRKRTHSSTERLQPSPFTQDQSYQMRPSDGSHHYNPTVPRQSNPFGTPIQSRASTSNMDRRPTSTSMDENQLREALMQSKGEEIDGQVLLWASSARFTV